MEDNTKIDELFEICEQQTLERAKMNLIIDQLVIKVKELGERLDKIESNKIVKTEKEEETEKLFYSFKELVDIGKDAPKRAIYENSQCYCPNLWRGICEVLISHPTGLNSTLFPLGKDMIMLVLEDVGFVTHDPSINDYFKMIFKPSKALLESNVLKESQKATKEPYYTDGDLESLGRTAPKRVIYSGHVLPPLWKGICEALIANPNGLSAFHFISVRDIFAVDGIMNHLTVCGLVMTQSDHGQLIFKPSKALLESNVLKD